MSNIISDDTCDIPFTDDGLPVQLEMPVKPKNIDFVPGAFVEWIIPEHVEATESFNQGSPQWAWNEDSEGQYETWGCGKKWCPCEDSVDEYGYGIIISDPMWATSGRPVWHYHVQIVYLEKKDVLGPSIIFPECWLNSLDMSYCDTACPYSGYGKYCQDNDEECRYMKLVQDASVELKDREEDNPVLPSIDEAFVVDPAAPAPFSLAYLEVDGVSRYDENEFFYQNYV